MEKLSVEQRIEALDQKMDLLLEYVNDQRLRNQATQDLINDLSIVGKDIYDTAIFELDKQAVELDPAQLSILTTKLLKNLPNFSMVLDTFESIIDLSKDAGPILNEVLIDLTQKLHELEQKGYMSFFKETLGILDNIISHYTPEDVRALSENVVTILETVRSVTQPEIMMAMNNAVQVFNSIEQEQVPSYSIFRLIREMNKPEMKKALGFAVIFMKNMSRNLTIQAK